MTRWKAAGMHLVISALVVGSVAAWLIFVWYGWELFQVTGGAKLVMILATCDVVIGPLLTLLVYKPGKKTLKFDLGVIALLQFAFFAYGLNVMREARPIFLVGLVDRFELVLASELTDEDLARGTQPEFRSKSLTGPRLIGGRIATENKEIMELALAGFAGRDIHLMPERYIPYPEVASAVAGRAAPVSELIGMSEPSTAKRLERAVKATGRPEAEVHYLPINSRRGQATMLVVAGTGEVLGPVAANPWPEQEAAKPGQ